jgi:hypothetical protein
MITYLIFAITYNDMLHLQEFTFLRAASSFPWFESSTCGRSFRIYYLWITRSTFQSSFGIKNNNTILKTISSMVYVNSEMLLSLFYHWTTFCIVCKSTSFDCTIYRLFSLVENYNMGKLRTYYSIWHFKVL